MSIGQPSKPDAGASAPSIKEAARSDAEARDHAFFAQRLSLPPEVEGEARAAAPVEARLPGDYRARLVSDYRSRLQDHLARTSPERLAAAPAPRLAMRASAGRLAAPATPGGLNWVPLGPSVGIKGNVSTRAPVSGRVRGIGASADGQRVYVASANGGVWRSDDGGETFYPLMNAFDQSPTANKSDSLACGAIAVHPDEPDRLYVGTGEATGFGSSMFFGVGVISSTDGGLTFTTEVMKNPSDTVQGSGFFAMVMDPLDHELAFGAADQGLFRRQPRNQDVPGLPKKKPQSYLLSLDTNTGSPSTSYWIEEGIATVTVWNPGATWVNTDTTLLPFTLNNEPWFVRYQDNSGDIWVYQWPPNAEPIEKWHPLAWTADQLLMCFSLNGASYIVRYRSAGGINTMLLRFDSTGTATPVWPADLDWGNPWTALVPFTLHGVPYFLRYNGGGGGNNTELMQWTGALLATRVGAAFALPQAAQLVPVEVNEEPLLLTYEPNNGGQTTLYRLSLAGTYTQIWQRAAALPAAGTVTSFLWRGQPRLLVYVTGAETLSLYGWGPGRDPDIVLLWTQKWAQNLTFMPFLMGYEWVYDQKRFHPAPTGQPGFGPENRLTRPRATSVVVARRSKDPIYYAAFWGRGQVYRSADRGDSWELFGELPPDQGRISLGVAPSNPNVIYAFTEVGSVFRYQVDGAPGLDRWIRIAGTPPPPVLTAKQGSYDLTIAVDPNDEDRIYLGAQGPAVLANQNYVQGAAIYRGDVTVSWTEGMPAAVPSISMTYAYIGASVHADVHVLTFTPGRSNALWVGCDGGVFYTSKANDGASAAFDTMFEAKNTGLSTMTVNDLAAQETRLPYDAIAIIGNQDNGNQIYTGSEAWARASDLGDSGRVVYRFNATPATAQLQLLATYIYATIARSIDGGRTFPNDASVPILRDAAGNRAEPCEFYAPLVSATGADYVVFGSGRPWVSADFGASWRSIPSNTPQDIVNPPWAITAMAAWGAIIYAGFADGKIFKYTSSAAGVRIDNMGGPGALSVFTGADIFPNRNPIPITSIAVSPFDFTGNSIYVTLGGDLSASAFGWQRVWFFGGAGWIQGGGTAPRQLMNVQHNTIVMDRVNAGHLYVGADIGVWRSTDWGQHWDPFGEGLPESPVLDLSIFPPKDVVPAAGGPPASNNTNLLRAVTHGRGVYERVLPDPAPDARNRQNVFLVVRASLLDRGLYDVQTGVPSPFDPNNALANITYYDGEDIKVSAPTNKVFPLPPGERVTFPMPAKITFAQFAELTNQSATLKANQPARVYVQVHNRGLWPGTKVRVTVLLSTTIGIGPPPVVADLPGGYEATVRAGGIVSGGGWQTLSVAVIDELYAGHPAVVSVDIPAGSLAAATYCVLALVTSPENIYGAVEVVVATLVKGEPKAAMKYLVVT